MLLNAASHGYLKSALYKAEACRFALNQVAASLPDPAKTQMTLLNVSAPKTYKEIDQSSSMIAGIRLNWRSCAERLELDITAAIKEIHGTVPFLASIIFCAEQFFVGWCCNEIEMSSAAERLQAMHSVEGNESYLHLCCSLGGQEDVQIIYAGLKYWHVFNSLCRVLKDIQNEGILEKWLASAQQWRNFFEGEC